MTHKLYIRGNSVIEEENDTPRSIVMYRDNGDDTTKQIFESYSQNLLVPFSKVHELLWSSLLYFLGCFGGELILTEEWQREMYKKEPKKIKKAISTWQK